MVNIIAVQHLDSGIYQKVLYGYTEGYLEWYYKNLDAINMDMTLIDQ